MGGTGDYESEMGRMSDEQVEAILSGAEPDDPSIAREAALFAELKQSLLAEPAPEVAERHLAAMMVAATGGPELGRTSPTPRRTRMRHLTHRKIAVLGLAAGLTLSGGLAAAAAGVLPGPAQDAVAAVASHVGINLPSSSDTPSQATHGADVSSVAQDPSLQGCEKGQAVASVASSFSQSHRQDTVDKPDPCQQSGTDSTESDGPSSSAPPVSGTLPGGSPFPGTMGPGTTGDSGMSVPAGMSSGS